MPIRSFNAIATPRTPEFIPMSGPARVDAVTRGEDRFIRPPSVNNAGRARLAEINVEHPKLSEEIKVAKAQAEAAAKRASWKGLKWYEKSLLLALPFGGLALAGIIDSLRVQADDAQAKLQSLMQLQRDRNALRA